MVLRGFALVSRGQIAFSVFLCGGRKTEEVVWPYETRFPRGFVARFVSNLEGDGEKL